MTERKSSAVGWCDAELLLSPCQVFFSTFFPPTRYGFKAFPDTLRYETSVRQVPVTAFSTLILNLHLTNLTK